MRYAPKFTYVLTPGSSTLDLSAAANAFSIKSLLAVVDTTAAVTLYAIGTTGLGYSSLSGGNVLTLQASMTGVSSTDNLIFFYDDGFGTGADPDTTTSGTISATDAVVTAPVNDGSLRTGTSTANSYVTIKCPGGDSAITFAVTGLTSGFLYCEGSLDSTTGIDGNWYQIAFKQLGNTYSNVSLVATANGVYTGTASSFVYMRVRSVGALSGTPLVRLIVGAGNNIYGNTTSLTASNIAISARGDGFLRTTSDPTTLIADTFETLDTSNVWTTGGTVPPTGVSGNLTAAPGTTANATSYITSIPKFTPPIDAYLQMVAVVQIETGVVTGNQRFWGLGVYTTPTTTAPIINGLVYEIDNGTGNLLASVYSGGARTFTTILVRPTDGAMHRYSIYFKTSRAYFELDNIIVASILVPNTAVASLGLVFGSINGGSTVASAPILMSSVMGIGDTARNSSKMNDFKYPWRGATVTGTGAQVVQITPDIARNITTYYMTIPVVTTATDTLMSLTSYKSNAAVAATTTPAVVTAGRTYRITSIVMAYVASATAGQVKFTLRVNTGGVVAIGSNALTSWVMGAGTPATAGSTQTLAVQMPDGVEIPSGAGIGISMVGLSPTQTLAASGYGQISIYGYEYFTP